MRSDRGGPVQVPESLKVLHVSPAFFPATRWGGPITSTYALCNALAAIAGVELRVVATDTAGPATGDRLAPDEIKAARFPGYSVQFYRRQLATSFSLPMIAGLFAAIRWSNVVHLTGVYSAPTIPTLVICRLLGRPVVWSARGSLQLWESRSRPALKSLWVRLARLATGFDTTLHVTSEQERNESLPQVGRMRVLLVANGVAVPAGPGVPGKRGRGPALRLLFIGRLHPIKAVENLIDAIRLIVRHDVLLSIYGEGDDPYESKLLERVRDARLSGHVQFKGRLREQDMEGVFAEHDVLVLPSHRENFGMVAAEALAHGIPVIASRGTPWRRLEEMGCGLWVENSPQGLSAAIQAMGDQDLGRMGSAGRDWMMREFSWDDTARKFLEAYRGLVRNRGAE